MSGEDATLRRKATIMDAAAVSRAITRLSHEITERNRGISNVVLIGILRRGEPLAARLADTLMRIEGCRPPIGRLDIRFYRDDLTTLSPQPTVNGTDIPFSVDGRDVILVDDVIFTGRTVRAAIDALFRIGCPHSVQLAVMIDRGLRELPIRPDYVGKNIPTSRAEMVSVCTREVDGEDSVALYERCPALVAGEP